MKKGVSRHPKTIRLAHTLGISRHAATGLLIDLWEYTGDYATPGDIGRHGNNEIAIGIGWTGDADELIDALTSCGWIDADDEHRLVVHDWEDGCEQWVKHRLNRSKQQFVRTPYVQHTDDVQPPSVQRTRENEKARKDKDREGEDREGKGRTRDAHNGKITTSQAEAIYEMYPRKAAKQAALRAIRRAHKALVDAGHDDPVGHLFRKTAEFAKSPLGQNPPKGCDDFRKHPATWFNGGCYDDAPSEWQKPNGGAARLSQAQPDDLGPRLGTRPATPAEAKKIFEELGIGSSD